MLYIYKNIRIYSRFTYIVQYFYIPICVYTPGQLNINKSINLKQIDKTWNYYIPTPITHWIEYVSNISDTCVKVYCDIIPMHSMI